MDKLLEVKGAVAEMAICFTEVKKKIERIKVYNTEA